MITEDKSEEISDFEGYIYDRQDDTWPEGVEVTLTTTCTEETETAELRDVMSEVVFGFLKANEHSPVIGHEVILCLCGKADTLGTFTHFTDVGVIVDDVFELRGSFDTVISADEIDGVWYYVDFSVDEIKRLKEKTEDHGSPPTAREDDLDLLTEDASETFSKLDGAQFSKLDPYE